MTDLALQGHAESGRNRLLFLVTICTGSFLLFLVQPMIARMALPRLGGAPSVWNSAMLVYQSLLLGGYAYAHALGRLAPLRQAMVHLALFACAALMLPIGLAAGDPPADGNPFFWVPWLLLTSIGPLFFVVSAQAPLMQRWFGLQGGGDPYALYAASNVGSFAGLLAYPVLVEPFLPVEAQSSLWSAGYVLLATLVLICAAMLPKGAAAQMQALPQTPRPELRRVLHWIVLAAVPSGLMLSTTLHLTTDIVAMPLIWVLPLGLYLLSFSIAFSERRGAADLFQRLAPVFIVFGGFLAFMDATGFAYVAAAVVLTCLFGLSTALHARMYDLRPAPDHLTAFYLAMSAGGVVGGLFCALIAPLVFDWGYEHPILLIAAALLVVQRPLDIVRARLGDLSQLAPARTWLLLGLALALSLGAVLGLPGQDKPAVIAVGGLLALGAIVLVGNRLLFLGFLMTTMMTVNGLETLARSFQPGELTRSYFGIYTVRPLENRAMLLMHGTTLHGVQSRLPGRETKPTTYYVEKSGVGLALQAAPRLFGDKARIGVVGLGAGTLVCYGKPTQSWRYYEIDPVVDHIARNPAQFSFISRCRPDLKVAIGDARIVLATEPAASADLLVVDAFSSDSIPMHLLTREAFGVYGRHLTAEGLLMVHISNRYFDLSPVLAAAARNGWTARIRTFVPKASEWRDYHRTASIWVAMSRNPQTIAALEAASGAERWEKLPPAPGFRPWTDSYGSVLPLLKVFD